MKNIKLQENARGVDFIDTETLEPVAVFGFLDDEEREYAGMAIVLLTDDYSVERYADDFAEFATSKSLIWYEASDFTPSNLYDYSGYKYFELSLY